MKNTSTPYGGFRQQDNCISRDNNTFSANFQCRAEAMCWHTKHPSTPWKNQHYESLPRPRACLEHDPTLIYRRLVLCQLSNEG